LFYLFSHLQKNKACTWSCTSSKGFGYNVATDKMVIDTWVSNLKFDFNNNNNNNPFCFIFSPTFKRIMCVLDLVLVQKGLDITLLLIRWVLIRKLHCMMWGKIIENQC
jgi:hypothetical protein